MLPVEEYERILSCLHDHFSMPDELEVTIEANPGTLSEQYLKSLHILGVNRLSLGVQSIHPNELRFLERQHDFSDVLKAVHWARRAQFDNINLDLIYGLPGQGLHLWQQSLKRVVGLDPQHLSLYGLSVEDGTPLASWIERGLCEAPLPDLAADMVEWAMDYLDSCGWKQYEISNWARLSPGGQLLVCQHNLQYWRNQPYLGYGVGAHGYVSGKRTVNLDTIPAYIQSMLGSEAIARDFPATPASYSLQVIDRPDEIAETMITGLRLVEEGINITGFNKRFGLDLDEYFPLQIERLVGLGLLEWADYNGEHVLRLTIPGRLLGNQVFVEFV